MKIFNLSADESLYDAGIQICLEEDSVLFRQGGRRVVVVNETPTHHEPPNLYEPFFLEKIFPRDSAPAIPDMFSSSHETNKFRRLLFERLLEHVAEGGLLNFLKAQLEEEYKSHNREEPPWMTRYQLIRHLIRALCELAPLEAGDFIAALFHDWGKACGRFLYLLGEFGNMIDNTVFKPYWGMGEWQKETDAVRDVFYSRAWDQLAWSEEVVQELLEIGDRPFCERLPVDVVKTQAGLPGMPFNLLRIILRTNLGPKQWEVRKALTENPSAPPDIIRMLATDENPAVREAVARRPDAPLDLLTVGPERVHPQIPREERSFPEWYEGYIYHAWFEPVKDESMVASGVRFGVETRVRNGTRVDNYLITTIATETGDIRQDYPRIAIKVENSESTGEARFVALRDSLARITERGILRMMREAWAAASGTGKDPFEEEPYAWSDFVFVLLREKRFKPVAVELMKQVVTTVELGEMVEWIPEENQLEMLGHVLRHGDLDRNFRTVRFLYEQFKNSSMSHLAWNCKVPLQELVKMKDGFLYGMRRALGSKHAERYLELFMRSTKLYDCPAKMIGYPLEKVREWTVSLVQQSIPDEPLRTILVVKTLLKVFPESPILEYYLDADLPEELTQVLEDLSEGRFPSDDLIDQLLGFQPIRFSTEFETQIRVLSCSTNWEDRELLVGSSLAALPDDVVMKLARDEESAVRYPIWQWVLEADRVPFLGPLRYGIEFEYKKRLYQKLLDNIEAVRLLFQENYSFDEVPIPIKMPLSEDKIRAFARDQDYHVRNFIALREDLPEDVLWKLSHDECSLVRNKIREKIVMRPHLTGAQLLRLAQHEDSSMRVEAARRKDLPESIKKMLARDAPVVASLLCRNSYSFKKVESMLGEIPEDTILELASTTEYDIQESIIRRAKVSDEVIRILAQNPLLQRKMIWEESAPTGVLQYLAALDSRNAVAIARRESLDPDLVEALSRSPLYKVRMAISNR